MPHEKFQRGFSLIEMMIALVLGTLVVAAIIGVFLLGNRSYREDDRFARMQENGRYALKVLSGELANAGFWGGIPSPAAVTSTLASLCDVTFAGGPALTTLSKTNASTANSTFGCINSTTFKASTDVVLVQRVDASPATVSTIVANEVYLKTNAFTGGTLVQVNPSDSAVVADLAASGSIPTVKTTYWRYRPHLYYIQDGATPVLHRRYLCYRTGSTSPGDCGLTSGGVNALVMGDDVIAEGVEQLRVFFGIDSDNDGVVNQFKANPTAAELNAAINAKLYILIRSPEKDAAYTDSKTYWLGDTCYNVAASNGCTALTDVAGEPAKYHRRVLTTTVVLRNPLYHSRYGG